MEAGDMLYFANSKSLPPCRLRRDDLRKLVRLMESGFPSDGCISTLHLWAEQGGAELSADNIEEFLGNARLSRRISALEVVVKCVRGGNAIRDVRLIFGVAASRIEVKGENRDWMDDVLQLVQGFLVTRRPRY